MIEVRSVVRGQTKRLEKSVNPADRRKLDEYLTAIREAEARIQGRHRWHDIPKPEVDRFNNATGTITM